MKIFTWTMKSKKDLLPTITSQPLPTKNGKYDFEWLQNFTSVQGKVVWIGEGTKKELDNLRRSLQRAARRYNKTINTVSGANSLFIY